MVTTYPAQIDTSITLPPVVDNFTPVQGLVFNRLREAIIAIEAELGVKPSGTYSTVRARLDAMELLIDQVIGTSGIRIGGDIGGTEIIPIVIGIQGNPISSTTPLTGQSLTWDGYIWKPSDGVTFSGDLSGTVTSQTVIGLQTRSVSSTAPLNQQALIWDGAQWHPDDLVGIVVTFGSASIVEVSQTITTPAFTASYSLTPIESAILTDNQGNPAKDVTSTPTAFNSNFSFVKNTFGATVIFTLTVVRGSFTRTPTVTKSWGQKLYWGVAIAGQTGAAFIQSLTGTAVTLSRNQTFTVTASGTQKIYYAHRTGYGTATFTVGGFEGGFTQTSTTISVTNAFGFIENYSLYESDNLGLGLTTVVVT